MAKWNKDKVKNEIITLAIIIFVTALSTWLFYDYLAHR